MRRKGEFEFHGRQFRIILPFPLNICDQSVVAHQCR